ncbi:uncharacterized protein LOC121752970 isoform X2 [Salvia splendens]|uniref:uncharacterized protein LOC121747919 isoform X2 n=1 Tax=Salvia splendens TaxID=180675 RepID=UPI001C2699A1|nr:uncharacterized protein LOC121747919 isoform X2 [Salvia splendens]XP_042003518.1 uncharacterized protein LOC121752482 isoform X2 [Salvia splendens]XP_042004017.1 uncharacterized protein LOC121752970 isoform X2 [Salvia splendens]
MASPNLSATAASSSASSAASSSVGSGSRQITDIRAPLWDHVTILEKPKPGGGNILWRCNYCPFSKSTSYTRVEAHLLQKLRQGIKTCPNVSFEMLSDMRREVEKCKELLERSKACTVSLPVAPSDNSKRTKRGPVSQLEKSWALQDRKHLDALIVRAMFSGGISFNFLRNPYFREAFAFACSRNLPSYTIPGYNRARESLLKQERRHIETLLESTKSTWPEKGVTICSDGWSDPQRRPIINFTAVSEKAPMFLRADNCEGEYKSKEYIAEKFYSNMWLQEGAGRLPPHKDKEISQMRMTCFKKFFRIPQELAAVKEEYARFSSCSEEFNDPDSIHDRWAVSPMTWWTNHGQSIPLLMSLAMKLLSQPASSSCCERNWSTYSFIHSVKRNALTPERAEDLVFVHSNLRHLSRRTDAYKKGETRMWDVGGDSFDSLSGVGLLEVADLSIDEPELQAVSFGLGDAEDEGVELEETGNEEEA